MSADFSNAYQEVLLDNLMVIIKQNFIFQTQLKMAEDFGRQNTELQNQVQKLKEENNSLSEISKNVDVYKNKAEHNTSAVEEKNRIQIALNIEMKKNLDLENQLNSLNLDFENQLNSLNNEIGELKNYVKSLEEIAPITKLKKINPNFKIEKKSEIIEDILESVSDKLPLKNISDGSSF